MLNARGEQGITALMGAVNNSGSIEVAKILIENGADVDIKDIRGKTVSYPLDKEIIDLLEKAQREKAQG